MQNTIGWCMKCWQQTVNNRNHSRVNDGWSTAGMCVTFSTKIETLDTEQREALEGLISPGMWHDRNLNAQSLSSLMRNTLVPKLHAVLLRKNRKLHIDYKTLRPVIFFFFLTAGLIGYGQGLMNFQYIRAQSLNLSLGALVLPDVNF